MLIMPTHKKDGETWDGVTDEEIDIHLDLLDIVDPPPTQESRAGGDTGF